MSAAAVHLELDPRARTLEYYVAAGFILLTAGVMSLYFLLILLELFNAAVRPVDHEHRRLVRLARAVLAHPETADEAGRRELVDQVHGGVRRQGALCLPCHSDQPTLLDFAEVGYPARWVESLEASAVVRQAMAIESGQTLYLPQILDLDHAP